MISSLLFFFALEGGGKLVVVEGVGSANCSADTSMEIAVAFELLHRLITDRNAVVNVAQTTFFITTFVSDIINEFSISLYD